MAKKVEIPTGIKILSVLGYISAGLGILFGIALAVGASFMSALFGMRVPSGIGIGLGLFAFIAGIFLIGVGILHFFIAR